MLDIVQGVRDTITVTVSGPPQYVYHLAITLFFIYMQLK